MAYSAVINFKNGIDITATVFGMENDRYTFTTSGLTAIAAAGGLPTGVSNVNPQTGIASDTVGFCAPWSVRKVVIT